MIDELIGDAGDRMNASVSHLRQELSKLRTGRASTALLDHIKVNYYGTPTPLNQVATISVTDARTISISPWDKSMVPVIDKAIIESDLGLNPMTASEVIRVPIPPLTEERRREISKVARAEGEAAKVSVRNIRRSCNSDLKELRKEKEITEDEEHGGMDKVQQLTNQKVEEIDQIVAAKEEEIMTI